MKIPLLMTVITISFILDFTLANDIPNPSKEDIILILEKIDKILQEKDYEKFRNYYPHFLDMLVKFWKQNEQKNFNLGEERWENTVEIPESTGDDVSNAVLRFMSTWLNSDEVKRKRGYHRALCHFKICNMGSKRNYWE